MPDKFQMVNVTFGQDVEADIEKYIDEQLEYMETSHRDLHQNKIPKWRKTYLGVPAEETKNFPFPNAANTVVQVVGETVDTMVARTLGLIWATHPAWVYQMYQRVKQVGGNTELEDMRRQVEDFMDLVGYDPNHLDLYRIESQWLTDAAKLGTSFLKVGLEDKTEAVVVGYQEQKVKGHEETLYAGPRVYKLRHEDVFMEPTAQTINDSHFLAVRRPLKKMELEERKYTGQYDKAAVEKILSQPDRTQPRETTQQELRQQGVQSPASPQSTAEWDIYECYFWWWHNGRKFRLIYNYHKKSKTVMRKVYNFLPHNATPVIRAKRGYNTDGAYGHGYAELLERYQEELSTTHNQRLDNATVANVRALRISPKARALDSNTELYPAALLIGEKDEIEAIQVGDVYPSTFKNEEMTLGLVARRAGISPAVSGSGSGGMMKKPAVYSAQGTLAVMQENNSVVGHTTSEFRHAHVQLGALLTSMYGKFGTNGLEAMFGMDSAKLTKGLEMFANGTLQIPIRSSNASLNKEVDKQAGMIMSGVVEKHYQAIAQVLQAIANPMVPPNMRDYLTKRIEASILLHKKILKDFGYDQPDAYVPEVQLGQQGAGQQPNQGNGGQGGMAPGGSPMAGNGPAAPGGGDGLVPQPSVGGPVGGLAPLAGTGAR